MKNVVIVGGGTAGWLAALFAERYIPDCQVTVIESSAIGVLGAGEGTVPNILDILDMIQIDYMALVRFCSATTKHAIRFDNWNGDGEDYYHIFHSNADLHDHPSNIRQSYVPIRILESIKRDEHIAESTLQYMMCKDRKNPFMMQNDALEIIEPFALHFDAKMLASFLREQGGARGIKIVDDIIEDVVLDGDTVQKLLSKNHEYECDIVYDCTGFRKTIISKLNPKWIDFNDYKTVDRAIPFIIPHEEDVLPPYTESIAMKYGWCWVIPTQERYGCGYTFDSSFISDEEVRKEILEKFPNAKIPDTVFKFESGYYEKAWIGNCIALGLSAGFIEPLEATSIFSTSMSIVESIIMPNLLLDLDDTYRDQFNEKWNDISKEIHNFVYLHYITERNDTEFWNKFSVEKAPPGLQKDLAKWSKYPLGAADIIDRFFNASSWYQVMQGIRMLPSDIYKDVYDSMTFNKEHCAKQFDTDKENKHIFVQQALLENDYSANVSR
jgi:tryptophan halogenase